MNSSQKRELAKEANRIQEAVTHSSQAQFEQAKIWQHTHKALGIPSVLLAGVAGVGGASKTIGVLAAGVIALLAGSLTALQTFLELPKKIESASSAGNAYLSIQQDSRIFENLDVSNLTYEDARTALDEIVKRQQDTNAIAPVPSKTARKRAKTNIDGGAQDYEVDK
jgi:hypothetical protein